ncbi:hypothetical protein K469DRAFT_717232, partial [Zopfia rhizophila CBS 207.26]
MCHWVLRVWQCGDSFFTKYSSCSFDRAVNDPANLLNPLHSSIRPIGMPNNTAPSCPDTTSSSRKSSSCSTASPASTTSGNTSSSHMAVPTVDLYSPGKTQTTLVSNSSEVDYLRDAKTGEIVRVTLSEIGKASRFGDKALGENGKCHAFEVVLQSKEATICPSCARSPKRAKLPPHARGCFGL